MRKIEDTRLLRDPVDIGQQTLPKRLQLERTLGILVPTMQAPYGGRPEVQEVNEHIRSVHDELVSERRARKRLERNLRQLRREIKNRDISRRGVAPIAVAPAAPFCSAAGPTALAAEALRPATLDPPKTAQVAEATNASRSLPRKMS